MRTPRPRPAARAALVLPLLLALLVLPGTLPAAGRTSAAAPIVDAPSATGAPPPADGPAPAFDTAPARAALERLLPRQATRFTLEAVARPASGDWFSVSGGADDVRIRGTSPAVLLSGVNEYLHSTAHVDIGWPGDSTARLPAVLPAPLAVTRSASVPHRFALNDTDDGYSGAYRDWAAWERQLDLLALHGVDEVFVAVGVEKAYVDTFQEFGYGRGELLSWVPGAAHQPWWLLQNMSSFGGPVTEAQLTARAALGRRIADRARELGMTPVLPGFFGTVPPGFAARNPGGTTVPQGDWVGFHRPDWLDPRGPVFAGLAASFYRHESALLGDSAAYKMDLLHEGGNAGGVPIGDAAAAVMTALQAAHPGATWVLLGWQNNPSPLLVDAVDRSRLLIVDGLSDRYDGLDREASWHGAPYAFGTIPNFGGHTTMGANTAVWAARFEQWRSRPGSALRGIAYLPEGTGGNPAAFELFTELAWHTGSLDQVSWFADYAARRYGGSDPHAAKAWELLRSGPYSMPSGTWSEPQDSLFTARPSLAATTAASWSPPAMRYDASTVQRALAELLQVAPALQATDAYRFDLVDTARQALANRSRALLPQLRTAYEARNLAAFRAGAAEWKRDLALLDSLLATDRRFLLGPWLAAARACSADATEQARCEYDARSLLTTWGGRSGSENGGLHDYADREWSGLVADFYAMRWTRYLDGLDSALAGRTAPPTIDWYGVEDAWNHARTGYPTAAVGDPVARAAAVRDALPALPTVGASPPSGLRSKANLPIGPGK